MAINWRFKNNHLKEERESLAGGKKKLRSIPFLGLGIFCFALFFSLLIIDFKIYRDNFKTASIFDMANGKYREDDNYVETCVTMYHDLVADTLYRDGYFFDTKKNGGKSSGEIYNQTAKLRSTRGLYTYVNQGHSSQFQLSLRSKDSDKPLPKNLNASFLPRDIELTFYNNGNAYSGSRITSYREKEYNAYKGETKFNKLGMTFYNSGWQEFMIISSDRATLPTSQWGNSSIGLGFINNGVLYKCDRLGEEDAGIGKGSYEFIELDKFAVKQGTDNKPDIASDYLYTVSDESDKYMAHIDVSLNSEALTQGKGFLEKEEQDNTLEFKEVWNGIFALAKYVPEKTPLLFLSYDDTMGFLLKGNQTYVKRYRELYGEKSVEVFDNESAQYVSSKRYRNSKDVYSVYPHESRTIQSVISKDKKIIALFADQNFNFQYKESPLYSYEMAAVVLRYSTMLAPILFLLSVCFLVIGIYRKQQKTGQTARVLAMGFLSIEMRGLILIALGLCLIYCYTMLYERNLYGYITPFLFLMFMIFVGSNICWWRVDKKSVFSNSWVKKLADHISERTKAYYQTHGMSFFLSKRSTQFACSELVLGILMLVAAVCKYTMGKTLFVLPLFGQDINVSPWTLVIMFLAVVMVFIFISYLHFLAIFVEGLNGVQRQLDLMGEGDFETVVPLPKNFYGFQVEEQFEAIKNGMMNAMEGEMRSERMKIDLVANVSHDIKTPLTSIINYVDLLADSKDLPAAEADYVQVLQRKSYRLRSMIQDLFDLSKATSGNLSVEFSELNFTKLIQQTMADMQEDIEASKLQFRCNLLEQVYIVGDGDRLYRVLQNLISNAINYSMEQSRVYLNLDVVDDHAVFSIKNMSRDEMNFTREQVMERFFRGDQSRSSEGSGLGVAIANSFVEVCGGEFDISIDADLFCATIRFPVVINHTLNQYLQDKKR